MSPQAPTMTILVMAGGTGGHVFPALAVAKELSQRGVGIRWLGTRRGLESDVVPKAGYEIAYINVSGLRGKGLLGWLLAPGNLLLALIQGLSIVRRINPAAVLGMGGFATGPGGLAAWMLRRPLVIHEQNAVAGLTNRLLTPLADRVLEAFPGTLKSSKALHTGNPVRQDIDDTHRSGQQPASEDSSKPLKLLVVGGSLGAQALNAVVPNALAEIAEPQRPQVWHQAGKRNIDDTRTLYADKGVTARVDAFIDNMAEAYAWADLVLCRAGALTIAELAMAGMPSILVPFPFAVDDHQTGNARYLSDPGAAILVQQVDLTTTVFNELLRKMDADRLTEMASIARSLALPDATTVVAEQCMAAALSFQKKVA